MRNSKTIAVVLASILQLICGTARGEACDARWPQVQFARDNLQRVLTEADFSIAQDYAERTRREFKHLAVLSERCDCTGAQTKFEAAAAKVHAALDSESRKDLREAIKQAQPPFDEGMKQLRECSRR